MKKVFLDDLPRWESGKNKGQINWKESIGYKVKFEYDNIKDKFEIISYNKINNQCEILYNKKKVNIQTGSLQKCRISFIIGNMTHTYKYNIGDIINTTTGKIVIIGLVKGNQGERQYEYKCEKDGYIGKIKESHLKNGVGCPVCSNKKTIKGINDIATTNSKMVKYFKNIEDTYTHTYCSGKKVLMVCPECGYEKQVIISSLFYNGFSCICSDGISYPEKIMLNMLKQLKINFEYQKIFDWAKNKRYDFYFELNNEIYIIETHGLQHYEEKFKSYCGGRTLEEEQENDRIKKELALQNGIKEENYIVIDCRYSKLEFIKNNILDSKLNILFNLNNIDWLACEKFALSNLVKKACDLWNNGEKSTKIIANKLELCTNTIRRYLKQGVKLSWCNYYDNRFSDDKIICLNNYKIYTYSSIKKDSNIYSVYTGNIVKCCNGLRRFAGKLLDGTKLKWMYYNDFLNEKTIKLKSHKLSKKVICFTMNKIFSSMSEAVKYYNKSGITTSNIAKCCQGKRLSAGKHPITGEPLKWAYYNEDYLKIHNKVI